MVGANSDGTCQSFRWSVGVSYVVGLRHYSACRAATDRYPGAGMPRLAGGSRGWPATPCGRRCGRVTGCCSATAATRAGRRRGRPAARRRRGGQARRERRTTALGEPGWWLLSDNPDRGPDSRHLRRGRGRRRAGRRRHADLAAAAPWRCARLDRCLTPPIPSPATWSSTSTWAARWRYVRPSVSAAATTFAGLHAGRRAGLRGDRGDPGLTRHYTWVPNVVAVVTDGTAVLGPGRHRPGGCDAGDGGQGGPVQVVRRRGRRTDLPRHHRRRGDHRDRGRGWRRASAASTSRTSRPRAASRSRTGSRSCSTSRSSTTTSTAPRWWRWPR